MVNPASGADFSEVATLGGPRPSQIGTSDNQKTVAEHASKSEPHVWVMPTIPLLYLGSPCTFFGLRWAGVAPLRKRDELRQTLPKHVYSTLPGRAATAAKKSSSIAHEITASILGVSPDAPRLQRCIDGVLVSTAVANCVVALNAISGLSHMSSGSLQNSATRLRLSSELTRCANTAGVYASTCIEPLQVLVCTCR